MGHLRRGHLPASIGRLALAFGIGLLGIVVAGPVMAQPWGPYWGGYGYGYGYRYRPYYGPGYAYGPPPPRVYEEEPDEGPPPGGPGGYPPDRRPGPGAGPAGPRAPVPVARIEQQVAAAGLRLVAKPRHNGRIYLAVAEDRQGHRRRLVFDAYAGTLIENTPLGTPRPVPPRPGLSDAVKPPLDAPKKAAVAPQPAEARTRPTDPLAIPKGPDLPPPPSTPAAPAAGTPK